MIEILPYLWIPFGYLFGSTPIGYLAGKLHGIDIREHGSGNIGATNVLRTLGKKVGLPVFALDVLKGAIPPLLARIFAGDDPHVERLIPVLTCVTTILGHNYTFWLGFKGGKGIATSAGAMLPVMPVTSLTGAAIWCLVFLTTRYVSIASLAAALSLPLSVLFHRIFDGAWQAHLPILGLALFMWIIATWRHKKNIRNLLNGTEPRFESKKKRDSSTKPDPAAAE